MKNIKIIIIAYSSILIIGFAYLYMKHSALDKRCLELEYQIALETSQRSATDLDLYKQDVTAAKNISDIYTYLENQYK